MASLRKPVIVRKFSRDWSAGYASANFGQDAAELEILDLTGKVIWIAWKQVKWVCYVKDFPAQTGSDAANPERLLHKRFSIRPRAAGLWMRMTLTDGDELEGLAANDRTLLDGAGVLLTPPDTRSNTQRVFVPRSSIRELEILGVIAPPASRNPSRDRKAGLQPDLFDKEDLKEILERDRNVTSIR